jgi:hypothetical protein
VGVSVAFSFKVMEEDEIETEIAAACMGQITNAHNFFF